MAEGYENRYTCLKILIAIRIMQKFKKTLLNLILHFKRTLETEFGTTKYVLKAIINLFKK